MVNLYTKSAISLLCITLVSFIPLARSTTPFTNSGQPLKIWDAGHTIASYLFDPLLLAHRWYWQIPITSKLYPNASAKEISVRKTLYGLGALGSGAVACITTPTGLLLRYLLTSWQNDPFLYCPGHVAIQPFDTSCSLFSLNACCVPGGYSITDGGVTPWPFRIQKLIDAISLQNADIVFLYEIFDIQTAHHLIEGLKDSYAQFFYYVGPAVVGLSSGLFIASKVALEEPEFTPFPKEALDGRAKYCNKGFMRFTLKSTTHQTSLKIYTTHMGHSEKPGVLAEAEIAARKMEMDLIIKDMCSCCDQVVLLSGDFNADQSEFDLNGWSGCFDHGIIDNPSPTWGGDAFSAQIVHKPPSPASTLDYTLLFQNACSTMADLKTSYIDSGFEAFDFKLDALSDHNGLFSIITLKK